MSAKKVIGILTGGGDVPGLNPAIRAVTIRATREGYQVIGIRRGWAGLIDIIRDEKADNSNNFQVLTEEVVNRAGRTGGTFLHSSRTRPSHVPKSQVPDHLKEKYQDVIDVLDYLNDVVRVDNMQISPAYASDRTIFAATWPYGILKSTNGGASWIPFPSPWDRIFVSFLALQGLTGISFSRAFSPTIMPAHAPIAGEKTAWPASATVFSTCALPRLSGRSTRVDRVPNQG